MKKGGTAAEYLPLCRVVVVGDTCSSEEGMTAVVARQTDSEVVMKGTAAGTSIFVSLLAFSLLGLYFSARAQQQQPFTPTVPIRIPAGTRGMQPDLALVYSPSGGNGFLGVGWTLTGVPAISRVNYGKGVNFDTQYEGSDTYAHSEVGVLVLQSDRTYRSKKESFMLFQPSTYFHPDDTCGDGPCSWTVTDRSGTKYFYGDTADSRLMVPVILGHVAGVKTWALSRVQDLFGNSWSVTYNQTAEDISIGQLTPNTITYTQGLGLTALRTVEFSYDTTRTDHEPGYYSSRGYNQALTRRLTGIQIKSAGVLLRQYVLSYEYGTTSGVQGRSRLRSIQEKDAAGNVLPPQIFTYEQGILGFIATPWGDSDRGGLSSLLTGDFDGDGKTDFANVYPTSTVNPKIGFRVQLSSWPTGSNEWAPPDAGPWGSSGTFLTGDFDGDGKTDIAFVYALDDRAVNCTVTATGNASNPNCDRGAIDVYRSVGYAFVKWQSVPCAFPGGYNWPLWGAWMTGDFNGDGKTDIAFYGAMNTFLPGLIVPVVRVYYGGTSSLSGIPDIQKADARTRLPYYDCDPSCKIRLPGVDGYPGQLVCDPNCPSWDLNWQQHATVLTGDYDGDGRTDIMVISDGGPPQYVSTGPSTIQFMGIRGPPSGSSVPVDGPPAGQRLPVSFPVLKCGTSWQQCGTFLSFDFNGDGKTDIVYLSKNDLDSPATVATDIFLSTGSGPEHTFHFSPEIWQDYGTFLKGDFDGDGKADLAYAWNNGGWVQVDVALGWQSTGTPSDWATWFARGSIRWIYVGEGRSLAGAFLTGDFDGQGKMDIAYAHLGGPAWTYTNLSNYPCHPLPPDLITDVSNGIGGTQHVEYVTAPNLQNAITPWNVTAPYAPNTSPQILVKSVQVSDGRIGNDGRIRNYTTNYSYENAQILPGTIDKQRNMGFQKIIATDAQTNQSIETQYRQDVVGLEGQPSDVFVRNGDGQYMRHLCYDYQIVNPAEQTEFVETTKVEDDVYEHASSLSSPAYVRNTSYQYDSVGNLSVQQNYAQGLPEFDVITNYDPDLTNWINGTVGLDQLKDRSVYSGGVQLQSTVYHWTNNTLRSISNWFDIEDRSIVSSMTYDGNGRLQTMTEPSTTDWLLPRTTTIAYDDVCQGCPKIITDAKGFTTQRAYTAEGELATFTDQNNEVTRYDYDGFGRKRKETRADGGTTFYNYNLTGNPNTQYTEIVTQVDTNNTISEKSYFDGTGFVYRSERTGDTGPICVFRQKDHAGRVAAVSNPTFNCSHGGEAFTNIIYEAAGRPDTITTPDGQPTRYTYEANNSHFPCPNGRLEHVVDANGRGTTRCIDSRERTVSITDPLRQVTTYGYDALGRPTNVSLPGGMSSTIQFDSLGRKTSLNDSQIGLTNFTYYDNGNLKSTTTGDAASYKTVTYNYDALNRATTKTVSDSQAGGEGPITFAYDESGHTDAIGRLTTVTGNNGLMTEYSYTPLGQPKVVSRQIVNNWTGTTDNFTETYTYDLGGRLTSLQYPDSSIANYYYTVGGNLERVDLNGVTRATWTNYDAFGVAANVQYQNGVNTAYMFDNMHHLTGLTTTKTGLPPKTGSPGIPFPEQNVLQNLWFDWYTTQTATNGLVLGSIHDKRKSTVINGVDTSETQTYVYDPLYRLASASGVWGTRTYSYDGNDNGVGIGNPTSFGGVTQRQLTFSGTKLTTANDSAGWSVSPIGYDPSGNMIYKRVTSGGRTGTMRTWRYKWTGENRLATAAYFEPGEGGTVTMLYDEAGQRFMKHRHFDYGSTTPDETTTYIGKAYERRTSADPNRTPERDTLHLFGNGQLIMSWTHQGRIQTAPSVATFFYHRNHINSSAVITNINGAEVNRSVYLPFGELSQNHSNGSDVVTDKYTGQISDPETGLYYYNARYYDPMVGRFLSPDPIVGNPLSAQSYNRYAYTRNNPTTNTDPSGSCPPTDPTTLCYGTPSSGDSWIGDVISTAGWLFGFKWLGYSSDNSGSKQAATLKVPAGTPSTPLLVDQSSSGNPSGTLARAQAINDIAELNVRIASHKVTPELLDYLAARGTVAAFGNLEFAGKNITDHPEVLQEQILSYTFYGEAMLLTGGLGTGLITLGELGIGGSIALGSATPLIAGEIEPALENGVRTVAQGQTGALYTGWGSGTNDALVNTYMAVRDLGQPLTGTELAAEMRALEAAGTKINWAVPSAEFAADLGVNGGLVRVVLGNVPGSQSVWTLTELPILNFFGAPIEYHLRVLP